MPSRCEISEDGGKKILLAGNQKALRKNRLTDEVDQQLNVKEF